MIFDYCYVTTAVGQIEIDDFANCCLSVVTDMGQESFMRVQSDLGKTTVEKFGPFVAESDTLDPENCKWERFSYFCNDKRTIKVIDSFLDPKTSTILSVDIIDVSKYNNKKEVFIDAIRQETNY